MRALIVFALLAVAVWLISVEQQFYAIVMTAIAMVLVLGAPR